MQLDLSRHVAAGPDEVWAVLTDIPSAHRTLSGVLAVEILTPGPYQPGLRWRETRRMFGVKSTEEMMVLTAEPPHSTAIVSENGGTEYKTVFTVTPDPDGAGSTLRMRFGSHTAHAPAISRVVMALMGGLAERATRKAMEQDLADIAAEAERRTD
ncbi:MULTISPECIES: SRPBCC family protein [unclassified Dietzia]|uniref:SRPBCC family protein n=1 Tax=unclassified Dietzia TaxID=2617939 RepID=UPI000D228AB8|nr:MULTISPECIES: SRPBCC family protein [unclassified Dietzia]AVZ41321.1 carbon monoxide dehydrogenase [Dietzia sp. JS16-p6b]